MTDIVLNDCDQKRYDLITGNLQEVLGKTDLKTKIINKQNIRVYWGTAPTGAPHLGYFVPFLKIAELLDADCEVVILVADLHAMLDNLKSTESQVSYRSEYYQTLIKSVLTSLRVDISKLKFVLGSSFQLSEKYTKDVYKANTILTIHDAQHAGADVVKQTSNPLMSGLLYPTLQALDIPYLNADVFFGGIDQRKICVFSSELLPKLGYKKCIHILNKMVPALSKVATLGELTKMSASDKNNDLVKIDLLETAKQVNKKIGSIYCLEGDEKDNTLLVLVKRVVFPITKRLGESFTIKRDEKFGGNLTFSSYEELELAFAEKKLHPVDLKCGISAILNSILDPVRKEFEKPELQELIKRAYLVK